MTNDTLNWYLFDQGRGFKQKLPPEGRMVLVQVEKGDGGVSTFPGMTVGLKCTLPPAVIVGYLHFAAGDKSCPEFITPGLGGGKRKRTHWCDCLGDEFQAPLWKCKQPVKRKLVKS